MKKTTIIAALIASLSGPALAQAVKTVDTPFDLTIGREAAEQAEKARAAQQAADAAIAGNPLTQLVAGISVASQMEEIAVKSGWTMSWEAADFQLDRSVPISTDIEKAVMTVVESANAGESKLRVTFYRGNNMIRVTDF